MLIAQRSKNLSSPDVTYASEVTAGTMEGSPRVRWDETRSFVHFEFAATSEAPAAVRIDKRTGTRFGHLADQWIAETAMLSSIQRRVEHAAYRRIIDIGAPALPFILERLRDQGGYWFPALAAIAGVDPAAGLAGYDEARAAWLGWGIKTGRLRELAA